MFFVITCYTVIMTEQCVFGFGYCIVCIGLHTDFNIVYILYRLMILIKNIFFKIGWYTYDFIKKIYVSENVFIS